MRKFIMLLVLAYPLMSFAQHDDIYFVPKKEKIVDVVHNADNIVPVEDEYYYDDEYVTEYYDDESYVYDDDYRYSSRILRFRSPGTIVGSSLYWDLTYGGMNDWVVYDDGYYLDVYPTYTNPYYWPRSTYNCWAWNSWYYPNYCWGYNHYYPAYHWNGYYPHHVHGGYRPAYIANNSWRPAHKVHKNVPVNNSVKRNNNVNVTNNNPAGRVNSALRAERNTGRVMSSQNQGGANRVSSNVAGNRTNAVNRSNEVRSTDVRRQQPQRVVNGGNVNQGANNVRPQQPRRTSSGTVTRQGENKSSQSVRTNTNNERRPQSSASSGSNNSRASYRSSSSSSGEYNRPSSTSVSRQRSSSYGGHSVSGGARSGAVPRGGSRR